MIKPENLLVIGNGADLTCFLKSGYDDFFKTRITQAERLNNVKEQFNENKLSDKFISELIEIYKSGNTSSDEGDTTRKMIISMISMRILDRVSFWEVPDVMGNYSKNWNGVESSILNFLTEIHSSDNKRKQSANGQTVGISKQIKHIKKSILNGEGVLLKSSFSLYCLYFFKSIDFIYYEHENGINEYKVRQYLKSLDLHDVLFQELKRFENNFKNYLKSETRHAEYRKDSKHLIRELVKDDMTNVLSFNYTKPIEEQEQLKNNIKEYVNIHGDLNRDIVFGIDSNWRMNRHEAMTDDEHKIDYFSKTFRLMDMKSIDHILSDDIKVIKFYGHSLSQADYSYFQSIFDKYDIYDSDVKVEFYYSRRWKNRYERQKAKKENHLENEDASSARSKASTMKNVYRLMSDYGETLDNKDHGKNLLHKMLLEGRISVNRIEIDN